ncbi:uncharacterized protein DS421_3g73450 [Arachis hypogaea]|nr:uncharacterized protein DS421_3g73450 [Arachis hypogaea]
MVGAKNSTAKSADNGSPRLAVKGNTAKPGGGFHVGHASSTAAPAAYSRRRFAPPYFPRLVHQETEAYHDALLCLTSFLIQLSFSLSQVK